MQLPASLPALYNHQPSRNTSVCVRSCESVCVSLDKSLHLLSVFIRGPVNLQIIAAVLYFNTYTQTHSDAHIRGALEDPTNIQMASKCCWVAMTTAIKSN